MSVKIKISYETDQELQKFLKEHNIEPEKCKKAEKKGKYYRAYIELKK